MPFTEALLVTLLGMSVVFSGLLLCVGFIALFDPISKRLTPPAETAASVHTLASDISPVDTASIAFSEPIPPDIQAVIAAALEVERRLYLFRSGARLTIRRPNAFR